MNREETAHAVEVLAASPAARWIGNKIIDGAWLQKCMRCGAEETLTLPPNVHGPEDVPAGFDEKLFDWKRSFQIAHEGCTEVSPAADTPLAKPCPAVPNVPNVTDGPMKRSLHCEKHGSRTWRGHVMCDACGRTYQTTAEKQPGHAPEICQCGRRLMPPSTEGAGDILGPRTDGVVIAREGSQYQAQDWTARPICYLCHRYVAKHHNGRVPIKHRRN